ncbi:hypothetical protein RND81_03G093500 [Saponaria officinalis]|uniref:Transposase n=1 Tax=Saponaria officinalis TaxID=3572 RepID=A0AAW1M7A0_SAPOF
MGKLGFSLSLKTHQLLDQVKTGWLELWSPSQYNQSQKAIIKDCLINKIIPAIKSKWPTQASKDIFIQQDDARPHISDLDPEFRDAAQSDGFNIHILFQPPISPDLNINDLSLFRALQALQNEVAATTPVKLVKVFPQKKKKKKKKLVKVVEDVALTNQSLGGIKLREGSKEQIKRPSDLDHW